MNSTSIVQPGNEILGLFSRGEVLKTRMFEILSFRE